MRPRPSKGMAGQDKAGEGVAGGNENKPAVAVAVGGQSKQAAEVRSGGAAWSGDENG